MNLKKSVFLGIILTVLNSSKAFAESLKTHILNFQNLEILRQSNPNFLKGIILNKDQVLVIEEDSSNQILNLSVFDDKIISGHYVDGVGMQK